MTLIVNSFKTIVLRSYSVLVESEKGTVIGRISVNKT